MQQQQTRSSCSGNRRHLPKLSTPNQVRALKKPKNKRPLLDSSVGNYFLFVVMAAVDICTTSSVYSRRTLAGVLRQMFSSSGAATNVPPAKEAEGRRLIREAAACPWHGFVP